MARATYGGIITDLKGSIGGTTFQHNYAGKIARARPTKYKGGAVMRTGVEPIMLARMAEWRSLSSANKTLWNAYGVSYTKDNYYAETKTLNGFNWYASINNNLERCGSLIAATPPARVLPLAVPTFTLSVDSTGIVLTPSAPYALGNNTLTIFTSCQVSNMFLKQRSTFRYNSKQTSGTVSSINLTANWETAHKVAYPYALPCNPFNIVAMMIHIEKSSGLATVGYAIIKDYVKTATPSIIGNNNIGIETLLNYSNQILIAPYVCSANGALQSFHAYTYDYFGYGDGSFICAVYDSSWNLIANSTSQVILNPLGLAWKSGNVISGASLTMGTTYYLAIWGNNPSGWTYQDVQGFVGGNTIYAFTTPYTGVFPPTLSSPIATIVKDFSLYANLS